MAVFSRVKVWVSNEVLTANALNAEFDNILNHMIPAGITSASATVSDMQNSADPGGVGTESQATNLLGEVQRLRFALKRLVGAQWYTDPGRYLTAGNLGVQTADIGAGQVTAAKLATGAAVANIQTGTLPYSALVPLAKSASPYCLNLNQVGNTSSLTLMQNLVTSITTNGRNVRAYLDRSFFAAENFPNASWKAYALTATAADETATIQAGTTINFLPTTIGYGTIIQATRPFSQFTFNVTQASASGVYVCQYWNGSSWSSFGTVPALTATGSATISVPFAIPGDWVPGAGGLTATENLYSVRVVSTTAPATTVQINSISLVMGAAVIYQSFMHFLTTGNSTTAGSSATINAQFFIERSSASNFSTYAVVSTYNFQTLFLTYNGVQQYTPVVTREISCTDSDAEAGLAAGTYYYRVRFTTNVSGNISASSLVAGGFRLVVEEVL